MSETREDRTLGPRPANPVDEMDLWRDETFEAGARHVIRTKGQSVDDDDLEKVLDKFEAVMLDIAGAVSQLADIEARWRAEDRGRWFGWGIGEVVAERAAISEYRQVVEKGRSILVRRVRERDHLRHLAEAEAAKRVASDAAQRAQQEREEARRAFSEDADLNRERNNILHAAYALSDAPAEEWGPDTAPGLRLRSAVAAYTKRRDELRKEHGQIDGE